MDHDALATRLDRVERFLDSQARGWRDESNWRRGGGRDSARDGEPKAELVVDKDQTERDREALGITDDTVVRGGRLFTPGAPVPGPQGLNPGIDDGKDAEIRRNFRAGKGAVTDDRVNPDDVVDQGDRASLLAQLEPYRGREGFPELTGDETNDQLRDMVATAQGSPAQAVALEGARANPAAEQAMQTAQDPDRQKRAEAQREQKRAIDKNPEAGAAIAQQTHQR